MKLSTKVAYNTIVQIASKIISTVLGLIVVVIVTRYLGVVGFGQYTTIVTFLSFLGIAADLGLTLVTSQMISRPGIDEEQTVGNLLAWRTLSALLFLGIGPLLVFFFPYPWAIKVGVMICTWSFFFAAMNQVFVGVFQKHLRMDKVSLAEIIGRLILVVGVILTVHFSWGLSGLLWTTVVSGLINFSWLFISAQKFVAIKLRFDMPVWREIFNMSWPMAITIIFNLIYLKTDTLILSLIKTETEVGIYGAAYKVIEVLTTIPFMFAGIILPIITSSWARKDNDGFQKVFQKSFDFMIMLALPLMMGVQFLSREIMMLVAGPEFYDSGPILRILIVAVGMIFIGCMFAHAVIAVDKQKKIIWSYVFVSITSVIGYLYFIPRYSYFGAAWMTVYSETAIFLASLLLVWHTTKNLPQLKFFWKALLATVLMAAAMYGAKSYLGAGLWATSAIAVMVYFSLLYLFRGITKKDLLDLLNK